MLKIVAVFQHFITGTVVDCHSKVDINAKLNSNVSNPNKYRYQYMTISGVGTSKNAYSSYSGNINIESQMD